jgi:peptidyl-prolyl cis-trans isomerase SurA
MRLYLKNNESPKGTLLRKDVEEYFNLYINFRLKVLAAIDERYDTNTEIKSELETYRKSVAEPYITDMGLVDNILKEAYNFSIRDLRANNILISLKVDALPADTLAAYKHAMEARGKLIAGEPVYKVALEYSDDVKKRSQQKGYRITGDEGDFGFFTAFQNTYPFEKAAFHQKAGEWSMPVRTIHGYQLVQVTDEHPALGKIKAAHIFIAFSSVDTTEARIEAKRNKADEIYNLLQNGEKFEDMVHLYSDDKASAGRGGYLGEFGVNRMLPSIIEALYNIKEGEYTKPVQSIIGFHIVKLISTVPPESFEELKPTLEFRIQRDVNRAELPVISFVEKMKKKNGFSLNGKVLSDFNVLVRNLSSKDSKWASNPVLPRGNKTLFTYDNVAVTEGEYADYVEKNLPRKRYNIDYCLNTLIKEFEIYYIRDYEMNRIGDYDKEFKALMDEYRDGIYLFDITNNYVWEKSIVDTVGMKEYFDNNRDLYKTPPSVKAMLFTYDVRNVSTPELGKFLKKCVDKNMRYPQIKRELEKKYGANVKCEYDTFARGDNQFIDNANRNINKYGLTPEILSGGVIKGYAVIEADYPPRRKEYYEVRGTLIVDYQNYLEKTWLNELRKKYTITIIKPVFESIFSK